MVTSQLCIQCCHADGLKSAGGEYLPHRNQQMLPVWWLASGGFLSNLYYNLMSVNLTSFNLLKMPTMSCVFPCAHVLLFIFYSKLAFSFFFLKVRHIHILVILLLHLGEMSIFRNNLSDHQFNIIPFLQCHYQLTLLWFCLNINYYLKLIFLSMIHEYVHFVYPINSYASSSRMEIFQVMLSNELPEPPRTEPAT